MQNTSIKNYGCLVRKVPLLHCLKSNPNPKFRGTAKANFVYQIGPKLTSISWTVCGIENKCFGMNSKTSISNATAIISQFVVYSSLILLCHPCHFFLSFLVVFLQPQEILTSPFTMIEHICMIKMSTLVEFEAICKLPANQSSQIWVKMIRIGCAI